MLRQGRPHPVSPQEESLPQRLRQRGPPQGAAGEGGGQDVLGVVQAGQDQAQQLLGEGLQRRGGIGGGGWAVVAHDGVGQIVATVRYLIINESERKIMNCSAHSTPGRHTRQVNFALTSAAVQTRPIFGGGGYEVAMLF